MFLRATKPSNTFLTIAGMKFEMKKHAQGIESPGVTEGKAFYLPVV